jgi:hypothetical protein
MLGYASSIMPHWDLNPYLVVEQVTSFPFPPKIGVLDHYQAPDFITSQCVFSSRATLPPLVAG